MNNQCSPGARLGLFVALLVFFCFGSALAQGQTSRNRPGVGDHSFTETVDVPSPFVRSYIRNRLGAGMAFDLEIPAIEIGGEPIAGLKGDLLFAILDFEYQYAIKDWIAVRARVLGTGRLGSDTLSLLSQGITMATGFEFGWLVRLQEREKTALSLDLNVANRSFTDLNIARFADEIVAGVPASLVRKTPSARMSGGLRFAWAASPLIGVSARGSTGYGESVDRTQDDAWFWHVSTAVDFDLRTKTSAPLGVAVGFKYDSFPEFSGDIADGVYSTFFRFSYLGREDFLLSLDVTQDKIPVSGSRPDLTGMSVTLSLRYYM
ncbi:MAG: hypothetical protein QNL91_03380 [Candidatus Krumholzibacteria bacterium]|nr:hypothetical protein [Candidatus Krumholzibacteria bacterium]